MRAILVPMVTLLFISLTVSGQSQELTSQIMTEATLTNIQNDGAFQIEAVGSRDECTALCKPEDLCRGSIMYETITTLNDVTTSEMECRLYNGLTPGSPYEIKRPTLLLTTAVTELNSYRAEYGLPPVTLNEKLIKASQVHANDMGTHDMMEQEGTDGSTSSDRAQRQNYYFYGIAENVAAGQKSWKEVFKAWQDSPGHNENLLMESAEDFGIALVYEPRTSFVTYWVMLMGSEQDNFQHAEGAITAKQAEMLKN